MMRWEPGWPRSTSQRATVETEIDFDGVRWPRIVRVGARSWFVIGALVGALAAALAR